MADIALDFLAAARAFRRALVADEVPEHEFARQVRNAVARLYLAAALLPDAPVGVELPELSRPDTGALEARLRARFGDDDRFFEVFDATGEQGRDAIETTLSSELADIDADLARAIDWLEQDSAGAVWQIRLDFARHWGRHAVDVLRPLHRLATYGVV